MSKHKKISFIKSAVRITGYYAGFMSFDNLMIEICFFVLVVSEIIGIYEEIDEA